MLLDKLKSFTHYNFHIKVNKSKFKRTLSEKNCSWLKMFCLKGTSLKKPLIKIYTKNSLGISKDTKNIRNK